MASKSRDLEEGPLSDTSQEEHKGNAHVTHGLIRGCFPSGRQRLNIDFSFEFLPEHYINPLFRHARRSVWPSTGVLTRQRTLD